MALNYRQLFGQPVRGFILKELSQGGKNGLKPFIIKADVAPTQNRLDELSWSLSLLNINSVRTPPYVEPARDRLPPLPQPVGEIIEPRNYRGNISYEDILPTKSVEEPNGNVNEVQAARLIVIRRKKMKKHKLKKLRKRMRYEWAKRRQKREMKKEKMFQAELLEHIKVAQSFDPAKYAAEKIAKSKEVELPPVWHGVWYPENIIKQLVEDQEKKEKEKEADEKRRASMSPYVKDYIKNIPK